MAYISGYDYDIFISYSHDDNTAPGERTGWVTGFCEYLEDWLVKKRHLKGLKIWFDSELNGNTLFDKAIEDRISRSALFFVLHSHNYLDSDYCRKELEWFFEHNRNRPEGLAIGDSSRLFNILINNLPYDEWPESLSKAGGPTSGFILNDANGESDYGFPTPQYETDFDRQLDKLVEAISKTLDSFPRNASQELVTEPVSSEITLFLADVPDTLRPLRNRLIAEVGDKARILDALPPPYPVNEHNQKLQAQLQEASFSLHLLDQWPGRVVDDMQDQTYPRLQAETAVYHPTPSMLWVPDGLSKEGIEDETQASWLRDMEKGERGERNFQFIRSDRQGLIDQVLQMIASLQRQSNSDKPLSFLIDTHQKDQRYAFKLADLLSSHDVDVEFNQDSRDPVKSLTDFEEAVSQVENLVIMFGRVAPAWLKGRMQTTVKVIADQFQQDHPTLSKLWIVLLPGNPGPQAIPPMPPLLQVDLLDNSLVDNISPALTQQLLNAVKKQGTQP